MAERRRRFLTGSERAEFEHIYGPLTVDTVDPRFVLVDQETEALIASFPRGVPPQRSQDPASLAQIRAHELNALPDSLKEGASDIGAGGGVKAAKSVTEFSADLSGSDKRDEPKGNAADNKSVAVSGKDPSGKPVKSAAAKKAEKDS